MENSDNISLVLHGIRDLRLEQRPVSKPGADEVLIAIQYVGICGSDGHFWHEGRINRFIVDKPLVLGHEASGIIREIGPGVTEFKPGDRIAIEPGFSCMKCKDFCMNGRYNLCPKYTIIGAPPKDGAICRYLVHPASFCHKVPDHLSLDEAALVEPTAVAVHGCQRAGLRFGQKVLITGAGPIGLLVLMVAKHLGASKICITDILQSRLELAKSLGADHVMLFNKDSPEQIAKKVAQALGGQPDVTMECTGFEPCLQLGIWATKRGGVLGLIGIGNPDMKLPIMEALLKEVDIRSCFAFANCHPKTIELIASGKINVKPLITHRYKLEDAVKSFEFVQKQKENLLKVLIDCRK